MKKLPKKSVDTTIIKNTYQKIVPFIVFVLALILLFFLVRSTITILLSSVLLAYVSFPIHKKIHKKIQNESTSIILSLIIITVIVAIPFFFLIFDITQQGYSLYNSLSNKSIEGALFGLGCTSANSEVCLLINRAERFSLEKLSVFGLDKKLEKIILSFEERIIGFILKIPIILAEIFLTLVISFFILKDWKNILKKVKDLIPMSAKTKNKLVKQFGDITHTVIYAQLFVAMIQGIIGTIGFYIAGVPFPVFLGVVLAFCALIPAIGTSLVWVPASLYLIILGYFSYNYIILAKGVGLFFYGLLIISTIDNFLLAKIVKTKAKVSQIIVIIGVIGGASVFGAMGIFIGPILLPLLITYFETFKERFD